MSDLSRGAQDAIGIAGFVLLIIAVVAVGMWLGSLLTKSRSESMRRRVQSALAFCLFFIPVAVLLYLWDRHPVYLLLLPESLLFSQLMKPVLDWYLEINEENRRREAERKEAGSPTPAWKHVAIVAAAILIYALLLMIKYR